LGNLGECFLGCKYIFFAFKAFDRFSASSGIPGFVFRDMRDGGVVLFEVGEKKPAVGIGGLFVFEAIEKV